MSLKDVPAAATPHRRGVSPVPTPRRFMARDPRSHREHPLVEAPLGDALAVEHARSEISRLYGPTLTNSSPSRCLMSTSSLPTKGRWSWSS